MLASVPEIYTQLKNEHSLRRIAHIHTYRLFIDFALSFRYGIVSGCIYTGCVRYGKDKFNYLLKELHTIQEYIQIYFHEKCQYS